MQECSNLFQACYKKSFVNFIINRDAQNLCNIIRENKVSNLKYKILYKFSPIFLSNLFQFSLLLHFARKSLTNALAAPFSTDFPLSTAMTVIRMDGWETEAPQGGGFRINNDNLWYFARQQLADASISLLILSCKPVHAVVRVNTKLAGVKSVFCRTDDSGSFQKFHNRDVIFEIWLTSFLLQVEEKELTIEVNKSNDRFLGSPKNREIL